MTSPVPYGLPNLGYGVGLRMTHYEHVSEHKPDVDWFEIISENFMDSQGRPMYFLDQFAERYPLVMHGVSMSIGTTDPIDFDYLRRLKNLAHRIRAPWISDHLCWTGLAHQNTHDLLPVPYNAETLAHVVERIRIVQDVLEQPIGMENPSTYVEFVDSDMTEWDFLRAMCEETGCMLLLDVNNVYVSCFNHGWDKDAYLDAVPYDRVVQFHLAGHWNEGTHIIDTHDEPVLDEVWDMYKQVHERTGGRSTLLEWDDNIPAFDDLHAEALKARAVVEGKPLASKPERSEITADTKADTTADDTSDPDVARAAHG